MYKKFFTVLLLAVLVVSWQAGVLKAQEVEDMWEFTFGTIVRISKDQVTILEFDFDNEEDVEVSYDVYPKTEFISMQALSDLRIGDEVEIEFKLEGTKRLIMAIAKDEDIFEDIDAQELLMQTEDQVRS